MKFRNTKLSKRTVALFAAAVILLTSGSAFSTRAALNVISDDYDATITLDQLSVALTENGQTVEGELYSSIGEKVEPTRTYEDAVGVKNDGEADEYVRVIVRKYWTDKDGNKTTKLDPSYIELGLNKSAGWVVKEGEKADASVETTFYYYPKALAAGESAALFDTLKISGAVQEEGKGKTVEGVTDGKATTTIITYTYEYDGYSFNVEAEAQSVQTHHGEDAVQSVWGVDPGDTGISF